MPRMFRAVYSSQDYAIGLYVGHRREEKCLATIFRNGESPFAFKSRYTVDQELMECVENDEKIWDAV